MSFRKEPQPTVAPLPNPAPQWQAAKFKFTFKSRSIVQDTLYYFFPVSNVFNTDTNALNFVYGTYDTIKKYKYCGYANSDGAPSNQISFTSCRHDTTQPNFIDTGFVQLTMHEIGHALGLGHTGPIIGPNPNGTILPGGEVDDFWLEDTSQFGKCFTNNMMGYCWAERDYLSPKQISYMHKMSWRNPVVKNMVLSYGGSSA